MKNRLASLHRKHDRSKTSFVASIIVHALIFGLVLVVAGRAVKKEVEKREIVRLLPPPPPPPPPPPAGGSKKKKQTEKKPIEIKPVEVVVPVEIPKEVPKEEPEVEEVSEDEGVDEGVEGGVEGGVVGGVVGGVIGGVIGGTLGGELGNPLPEEPPSSEPRRITSDIQPPVLVKRVEPEYPIMAKRARASGEVVLECIIDQEGNVSISKVLKKVDMVQQAAEEAVKQWKYTPALMEGRPQAVYLIVRVKFNLTG